MFLSMYQGGITPARGPTPVRSFIARAHGRTSSYVTRDIGATPSGRWQFWQLRCRIGAMSLAKVTSGLGEGCGDCAVVAAGSMTTAMAARTHRVRLMSDITLAPPPVLDRSARHYSRARGLPRA